ALSLRKRHVVVHPQNIAKSAPPVTQAPEPVEPKPIPSPPSLPSLKVRLLTDAPNPVAWLDDKPLTADLTSQIPHSADSTASDHNVRVSNGSTEVSFDLSYDSKSWPAGITRPRVNAARVFVVGILRGTLRAQCSIPAPIFIQNRPQPVQSGGLDLQLQPD